MIDTPHPPGAAAPMPMYSWRRVALTLGIACVVGLLISPSFVPRTSVLQVIAREMALGLACLTAFGLLERWPRRTPRWIARWALQVLAVVAAIPIAVLAIYAVVSSGDEVAFWKSPTRVNGMVAMIGTGLLVAPWAAVAALFSQRELTARNQALAFELARSELERKALDARLRVVHAQVEPHFLFNTLANVRELVVSGSPRAAAVLDSLIEYLRAAVPRLHEAGATLEQELQLVRSYLDLMQMRMPDRLRFSVDADASVLRLRCPPTTILTLVENAVRHGIDPTEDGGRIDVRVTQADGRCRVEVIDTGAGLQDPGEGLGTGLAALRERLALAFGGAATVRLVPLSPRGVRAEAEFPAMALP